MSRKVRMASAIGRVILALAIALIGYFVIYRPMQLRWGATDEEVARAMPGDEIQPYPIFNATRAVTIDASPEVIWPWIVQIGYLRAGWYGYDSLDNAGVPSARQVIPELQNLKVGDIVPVWEGAGLGLFGHRVAALEANRYLLVKGDDGSITWVWALYPVDEGHTRLVWRQHHSPFAVPFSWLSAYVPAQVFTDAVDFIAVRHNMLGIKERVEGAPSSSLWLVYGELALWFLSFVGYLVANVGVVVWRDWRRAAMVAAAASLLTIGIVVAKPAVWLDGLAVLLVYSGLWWARRKATRRQLALAAD